MDLGLDTRGKRRRGKQTRRVDIEAAREFEVLPIAEEEEEEEGNMDDAEDVGLVAGSRSGSGLDVRDAHSRPGSRMSADSRGGVWTPGIGAEQRKGSGRSSVDLEAG